MPRIRIFHFYRRNQRRAILIRLFLTLIAVVLLGNILFDCIVISGGGFIIDIYLQAGIKFQSFLNRISGSENYCFPVMDELIWRVKISEDLRDISIIEDMNPLIKNGHYRLENCTLKENVAIIIPFRNRESQYGILLDYLLPMLQKQKVEFGIYIIEQKDSHQFNKGALMNIGYLESLKLYNYTCFIFHDVDLIPENENLIYSCDETSPKHMAVAVQTMQYQLPYEGLVGGVLAMTKDQFSKVNGFSNSYLGWGGEDDDMFKRIHHLKYEIARPSKRIARYHMITHEKEKPTKLHVRIDLLLNATSRLHIDGLSNMTHYKLKTKVMKLYTWIEVELERTREKEEESS